MDTLEERARRARIEIIELAHRSGSGHVGCALSCVDILVALYFGCLDIDPAAWDDRDLFVLSKAHADMALYAVLHQRGLLDDDAVEGYCLDGGTLPAHLDRESAPAIEVSAGSLGHGFNMALGMAHGLGIRDSQRRVCAVVGDGECQEGSIWEGALFAPRLATGRFCAILDRNGFQGYDKPDRICAFEPIEDKWRAFGWEVLRVDGHDPVAVQQAYGAASTDRPTMIVADTVQGKGVSFMENTLEWHYYRVTDELRLRALEELGAP